MKRILILKNENNDFEKYISDNMKTDYVEVSAPYKEAGKMSHYIRAVCKRLNIHILMGIWLNNWKYKLDIYKTIIVFDNGISTGLLKWIKKECPGCNLKVWMWNVPLKQVDIFKQYASVYCFDKKYSLKNGLEFIEQFYFEPINESQYTKKYDLSFVGLDKGRYQVIQDIADFLNKNNHKFYFYIVNSKLIKKRYYKEKDCIIKISSKEIAYRDVIRIINESKAVLEIMKTGQEGLTLRALEAMFYKKKLVTNNKNIIKYNWYNPDNIFILGVDKMDKLGIFLDSPFINIDKEFLYKHTYKSWLTAITRGIQADVIGEGKNAGN